MASNIYLSNAAPPTPSQYAVPYGALTLGAVTAAYTTYKLTCLANYYLHRFIVNRLIHDENPEAKFSACQLEQNAAVLQSVFTSLAIGNLGVVLGALNISHLARFIFALLGSSLLYQSMALVPSRMLTTYIEQYDFSVESQRLSASRFITQQLRALGFKDPTKNLNKEDLYFREEPLKQLEALIQNRQSPIIVGPSGCGKTELVKALALRSKESEGKRHILQISLSDLIQGANFLGQLEEKFKLMTKLIELSGDSFVIFIDECQGLSTNPFAKTLLDLFKEHLNSGEMTVIFATTGKEFKSLDQESSFLRRLEQVSLKSMKTEETKETLKKWALAKQRALSTETAEVPTRALCEQLLALSESNVDLEKILEQSELLPGAQPAKAIKLLNTCVSKILAGRGATLSEAIVDRSISGLDAAMETAIARLKTFGCIDLAEEAPDNAIIPRDEALEKIVAALESGASPVLVGEAGAGKTQLVTDFARIIASEDPEIRKFVPKAFHGKRVLQLSLRDINTNTHFVGSLATKMDELLKLVKQAQGKVILFIDELHGVRSAGSHAGKGGADESGNLANLLKEPLAKGELQLMGATTIEEYPELESDQAFNRRLQRIAIEPTKQEQTILILRNYARSLDGELAKTDPDKITGGTREQLQHLDEDDYKAMVAQSDKIEGSAQPSKALKLMRTCVGYLDTKHRIRGLSEHLSAKAHRAAGRAHVESTRKHTPKLKEIIRDPEINGVSDSKPKMPVGVQHMYS